MRCSRRPTRSIRRKSPVGSRAISSVEPRRFVRSGHAGPACRRRTSARRYCARGVCRRHPRETWRDPGWTRRDAPLERRRIFRRGRAVHRYDLQRGPKFLDARERLRRLADGGVFSFLHLAQVFPGEFLPFGPFEPPSALAAKRDDLRRTYDLLDDDESRRQFVGHLRFRLHSDFAALPPDGHEGYFPRDLFPVPLPDDVRFVDCGAYHGDTITAFLRHQDGLFSTIDAFEPDAGNFRRLAEHVASLGPDAARRIALHQAGVGATREARSFNATGNMAAAFNPSGATRVPIVAIDDLIVPDERPVFVKYDIEGGESEALSGTSRLIRLAQPLLAISIYHRPDDLWQLPLQARSLNPDYRLYVRTQGEDGTDVVCYAIPA